jgi:hypothetical protein
MDSARPEDYGADSFLTWPCGEPRQFGYGVRARFQERFWVFAVSIDTMVAELNKPKEMPRVAKGHILA